MSTVADRIAWVLAHKGWSARELARRSDLSETTVSAAIRALAKDPDGIVLRTLKAIAKGAGVSVAWLVTGEGSPDAVQATIQDLWPQRTAGADLARREGTSEAAVDSVLAEAVTQERAGHSATWWAGAMRLRDIELHERTSSDRRPRRRQPAQEAAPSTAPVRSGSRVRRAEDDAADGREAERRAEPKAPKR